MHLSERLIILFAMFQRELHFVGYKHYLSRPVSSVSRLYPLSRSLLRHLPISPTKTFISLVAYCLAIRVRFSKSLVVELVSLCHRTVLTK